MTGPVDTSEDLPLDPDSFRHHLLLLKSMHCGRPVLYQGQHRFVSCLTANQSGCDIDMIVYLTGQAGGIGSREIVVPRNTESEANK
jgi:hypothetical protein